MKEQTRRSEDESAADGMLLRLAAFSTDPNGGISVGVWIGETLPSDEQMQRIAAEVGYSETAFVVSCHGRERKVRYFSPETEVTFCGHATIAACITPSSSGTSISTISCPVSRNTTTNGALIAC